VDVGEARERRTAETIVALPLGDLRHTNGQSDRMARRPGLELPLSPSSLSYGRLVELVISVILRHPRTCHWCWTMFFVSIGAGMTALALDRAPIAVKIGALIWTWVAGQ
jgi:hypothetical protein